MEWRKNHFVIGPEDNATYKDGTRVPVGSLVIPIAAHPSPDDHVTCNVCGCPMKPVWAGGSFVGWHCVEHNHGPARKGGRVAPPPVRPLSLVSATIQGDLITTVFRLPS